MREPIDTSRRKLPAIAIAALTATCAGEAHAARFRLRIPRGTGHGGGGGEANFVWRNFLMVAVPGFGLVAGIAALGLRRRRQSLSRSAERKTLAGQSHRASTLPAAGAPNGGGIGRSTGSANRLHPPSVHVPAQRSAASVLRTGAMAATGREAPARESRPSILDNGLRRIVVILLVLGASLALAEALWFAWALSTFDGGDPASGSDGRTLADLALKIRQVGGLFSKHAGSLETLAGLIAGCIAAGAVWLLAGLQRLRSARLRRLIRERRYADIPLPLQIRSSLMTALAACGVWSTWSAALVATATAILSAGSRGRLPAGMLLVAGLACAIAAAGVIRAWWTGPRLVVDASGFALRGLGAEHCHVSWDRASRIAPAEVAGTRGLSWQDPHGAGNAGPAGLGRQHRMTLGPLAFRAGEIAMILSAVRAGSTAKPAA